MIQSSFSSVVIIGGLRITLLGIGIDPNGILFSIANCVKCSSLAASLDHAKASTQLSDAYILS